MKLPKLIFLAGLLAAPMAARGSFIAPNLPAGSQYELAFVTRDIRDATTPYIADYNTFVTSEAAQDANLPQGISWHAIASAAGDIHGVGIADANANAPFTSSIPVYNTHGQLVANATAPLYGATGVLINPIDYDQFGNVFSTGVWTGSNIDGTADAPLGGESLYGSPDTGASGNINSSWIHGGSDGQGDPREFYALSSPITVTAPEPSTIALLTTGFLAGILAFREKRARTISP